MKAYAMILILGATVWAPRVYAMGPAPLSEIDQERLQFAKELYYDDINKQQWQIGDADPVQVDSPDAFIEAKEGVYYTGRVLFRTWGQDMKTPIDQYPWDSDRGDRWWTGAEMIIWDRDQQAYIIGFQGPQIISEWTNGQVSQSYEVILGPEPDWSKFKRYSLVRAARIFSSD